MRSIDNTNIVLRGRKRAHLRHKVGVWERKGMKRKDVFSEEGKTSVEQSFDLLINNGACKRISGLASLQNPFQHETCPNM